MHDLVSYVIASIATLRSKASCCKATAPSAVEIARDAYLEIIIYKKTASLVRHQRRRGGALGRREAAEQVARKCAASATRWAWRSRCRTTSSTSRGAAPRTGKPSNNDLREHKITLPLLLLLDRADAARRDELLALLARCREDEAAVDALEQAVEEQGGLQEASKVMQSYLQRATALLAEWPDGPIRSALVNLCAYVAERDR